MSISVIEAFKLCYAHGATEINPEDVDYHLELAEGILETYYTKDSDKGNLIQSYSSYAIQFSKCLRRENAIRCWLSCIFLDNEDEKMYAEFIASKIRTYKIRIHGN